MGNNGVRFSYKHEEYVFCQSCSNHLTTQICVR